MNEWELLLQLSGPRLPQKCNGMTVLEVAEITLGGFCEQTREKNLAQAPTGATLCPWSRVKAVHSFIVCSQENCLPCPACGSEHHQHIYTHPSYKAWVEPLHQALSHWTLPGAGWEEDPEAQRCGVTLPCEWQLGPGIVSAVPLLNTARGCESPGERWPGRVTE